jgi:hypothetical protein
MSEKSNFIGKYLDKKMKNHGLRYGREFHQLLANMEIKAEKSWIRFENKKIKK